MKLKKAKENRMLINALYSEDDSYICNTDSLLSCIKGEYKLKDDSFNKVRHILSSIITDFQDQFFNKFTKQLMKYTSQINFYEGRYMITLDYFHITIKNLRDMNKEDITINFSENKLTNDYDVKTCNFIDKKSIKDSLDLLNHINKSKNVDIYIHLILDKEKMDDEISFSDFNFKDTNDSFSLNDVEYSVTLPISGIKIIWYYSNHPVDKKERKFMLDSFDNENNFFEAVNGYAINLINKCTINS